MKPFKSQCINLVIHGGPAKLKAVIFAPYELTSVTYFIK